jgi:hypothetical protein
MSQQINDNFQLLAGLPIDDRNVKATITDRDAISSTRRFQGLQCFVQQTQTLYQLQGGILNSNWVGIAGANSSNALESVIDGFYVLLAGKTTPLDFEINDKFRGWIGYRYLVGTILSLPVSLPSDIDNTSKVKLSIDSNAINNTFPKIQIIATASQTVFPLGTAALAKSVFWNGVALNDSDWSQSGSNITTTFGLSAGDIFKPI